MISRIQMRSLNCAAYASLTISSSISRLLERQIETCTCLASSARDLALWTNYAGCWYVVRKGARIILQFVVAEVQETLWSFQVPRRDDVRSTHRLLSLRWRDRPRNLPKHLPGRGGLPRGTLRRHLGAGKRFRREAFGARPKVIYIFIPRGEK